MKNFVHENNSLKLAKCIGHFIEHIPLNDDQFNNFLRKSELSVLLNRPDAFNQIFQ